jgi:hypothetical protein
MHKPNFKSSTSQNVTLENKRLGRLWYGHSFLVPFFIGRQILSSVEDQIPMFNNLNDYDETNIEYESTKLVLDS